MMKSLRIIGSGALAGIMYDPICFVYKWWIRTPLDFHDRYGNDAYALVTGASDGIGKAFCRELAAKGMNIILVGRNQVKLDTVADEIRSEFNVKTKTIAVDLERFHSEISRYVQVKEEVGKHDIAILINNVGGYLRRPLNLSSPEDINHLNALNCYPSVHFTSMILPNMKARPKKSAIINVSSMIGKYPMSGAALYVGTKGFIYNFSQALSQEVKKNGIDVLTVCPAKVKTNFHPEASENWNCPHPEKVAEGALRDLGFRTISYGHWSHDIIGWALGLLPESIRLYITNIMVEKKIIR